MGRGEYSPLASLATLLVGQILKSFEFCLYCNVKLTLITKLRFWTIGYRYICILNLNIILIYWLQLETTIHTIGTYIFFLHFGIEYVGVDISHFIHDLYSLFINKNNIGIYIFCFIQWIKDTSFSISAYTLIVY